MWRRLCRCTLRVAGWRLEGQKPPAGVIVGAPHTSNWDFVLTLLVTGAFGIFPLVMVKKEWFWGPIGWFLRLIRAVPVDRRSPGRLIRDLLGRLTGPTPAYLVVAAEGTRKKADVWKSGFYRIALRGKLPVTLAFIDGPTKTTGFGPTMLLTGEVSADMDHIRAFYADKYGLRPAGRTEPRLREENRAEGQAAGGTKPSQGD